MIVDIDGYFGLWPHWPLPVTTADKVLQVLDRYRVDAVAMSSLRSVFSSRAAGNAEVLRLRDELKERLMPFAVASPTDGETALRDMEACQRAGMKGLKLLPQHHLYRLDDDPILAEMVARAEAWHWPVFIPLRISGNWGVPRTNVDGIEYFAAQHPGTQFILGGVAWADVRDALATMRRQANVVITTTCLQMGGGVAHVVREAGAERVLLGTAFTLQYPGPVLAHINHAEMTLGERELVLGGNAQRILYN